ncbi:EAL domain-containing protein [Pseudomonas saxonica]|uniref:cyclic-guanylate-specific phosphodiesterase n=1 Tax=Pseudomonas saxonica TaxID=2600598 RepID=A0ABY3GCH5_9PSED|nr:cyclic diguanylate phosphodiesterase [Pseudomonas saxonica]TWR84340.1 EAL domain-containing protein [Pseudomonas saxonica]WRQ74834.1 EAL domain-containing protein [Pseudomonas saxonica]
MPFKPNLHRNWTERYALVVLSGLLPIVLGIVIMVWQTHRTLTLEARQTGEEAMRQFDLMLDNAALAADVVLPLAGQDCPQVELALRDQVTRRPFVRSVNLVWDNQIYCTSLFGSFKESVDPTRYADGVLWLMSGNPVTPDEPLMVYRKHKGHASVLVSLYGFHLVNALGLINPKTQLLIEVGNNWIDRYGEVHSLPRDDFPVSQVEVASTQYPYRVVAGFGSGTVMRHMIEQSPILLGLLIFLGGISAATVLRLKKRATSPSRELQRGLEAEEFVPYFQPVVKGDNKQWAGAEVLMRWQHPTEGLVRPDLFIPLAEHSGLIVPMTRSLMRQTAELLAPHVSSMAPRFHIGFNITALHCHNLELIEDCRRFLNAFPPESVILVLELTERELVIPSQTTHALFDALHTLGVMIALDDFGTGHSSLNYLRELNVDYLKIDQSFVAMIGADALSGHILDTIIDLCAKLDLGIVAEGIETPEQSEYLSARGVDFLQGYLFSRPLDAPGFIEALLAHRVNPG